MTQEDKQLLLVDLCARLPFRICANLPNHHLVSHKYIIHEINVQNGWTTGILDCAGRIQIYGAKVEDIKPYLRPMSSMTEEEHEEYRKFSYYGAAGMRDNDFTEMVAVPSFEKMDYLNLHHFDYRGLIEKGLAIKAPKGMYGKKE